MSLAYDRAGHGPPLVLLHPLGGDRRVWDPVLPHLTGSHEVITVDLPGFGESAPLDGGTPPTPKALAAALGSELAALDVQRPHVAGNSLGGWVALELALAGGASGVTGIAPAGLWPEPLVPKASIAHRLVRAGLPLVGPATAVAPLRSLLLRGSVAHPRRVPAADAARLLRAYAAAPGFIEVNDAMRSRRFEGLERIRVPVTLVWPERDRLVRRPRWVPDRIRNLDLPDAGHIPMWDAPEALAAILRDAAVDRTRPAGNGMTAAPGTR